MFNFIFQDIKTFSSGEIVLLFACLYLSTIHKSDHEILNGTLFLPMAKSITEKTKSQVNTVLSDYPEQAFLFCLKKLEFPPDASISPFKPCP
jgi:hypothetical protein